MAHTHASISSGRTSAGRLWTPELNLDLMGRDWAVLDLPDGFLMPENSVPDSIYPSTGTLDTISIDFPTSWNLDDEFGTMEAVVEIYLEARTSGANFDVVLEDSTGTYASNTITVTGATYSEIGPLTLEIPDTAVPTGRNDYNIRVTPAANSGGSLFMRRQLTQDPDCHVYVKLTSGSSAALESGTGSGVADTRRIDTGTGLTGGGDLSADRTHAVDFDTVWKITRSTSEPATPTGPEVWIEDRQASNLGDRVYIAGQKGNGTWVFGGPILTFRDS